MDHKHDNHSESSSSDDEAEAGTRTSVSVIRTASADGGGVSLGENPRWVLHHSLVNVIPFFLWHAHHRELQCRALVFRADRQWYPHESDDCFPEQHSMIVHSSRLGLTCLWNSLQCFWTAWSRQVSAITRTRRL